MLEELLPWHSMEEEVRTKENPWGLPPHNLPTNTLFFFVSQEQIANRNVQFRYDTRNNDSGRSSGFGTYSGGGYPMALSYDQYGGMRLGG